jgi:hypothetical protein
MISSRFGRAGAVLSTMLWVSAAEAREAKAFDPVAEQYVKLALAIGEHSGDYVDAYYGPAEWRDAAKQTGPRPLPELQAKAEELLATVAAVEIDPTDQSSLGRRDFLQGQLGSAHAYLRLLAGEKMAFDDEARALYGITPPTEDLAHFEPILERIDHLLPGEGSVVQRYLAWRAQFAVPLDKLETVTRAAIDEARKRTLAYAKLPSNESFTLSLVTDKPWGAYNWYRGNAQSLIEVNVSLPVYLSQVVHYAAHEGYPGHHVHNVLQEVTLARGQNRVEHMILPLFSPVALIAEGSAEAGVGVVFSPEERREFERDVLFPLAGLHAGEAQRYAEVRELVKDLSRARVQLARRYLDGEMSAAQVEDWLVRFGLVLPEEAKRSLRFFDTYRSYIVNYSVGEQVVTEWLDARAGGDRNARWNALIDLLSSPRLPAALLARPAR